MQAEKPIALNGITDIVSRADLADRCIFVAAERILDKDRKPKQDLMTAFEPERPRILGALLDAVSRGIATLSTITSNDWPRMADFAKWATACESVFTTPGSFKAAYQRNLVEAVKSLLDDDLVAVAVQRLKLPWEGPARKMLEELNSVTGQAHINAKDWPKEPNALSARLRRLAPLLRSKAINAEKLQRTGAKRGWRLAPITLAEGKTDLPSQPSPTKAANEMERDDNCTTEENVTRNPTTINKSDGCDVSDDKFTGVSGPQRATSVPSDIDAAYEELRVRGDAAAQSHQPLRQPRQRIRIRG